MFLSMDAAFDGFAYNAFRKIMCGGMPAGAIAEEVLLHFIANGKFHVVDLVLQIALNLIESTRHEKNPSRFQKSKNKKGCSKKPMPLFFGQLQ